MIEIMLREVESRRLAPDLFPDPTMVGLSGIVPLETALRWMELDRKWREMQIEMADLFEEWSLDRLTAAGATAGVGEATVTGSAPV